MLRNEADPRFSQGGSQKQHWRIWKIPSAFRLGGVAREEGGVRVLWGEGYGKYMFRARRKVGRYTSAEKAYHEQLSVAEITMSVK